MIIIKTVHELTDNTRELKLTLEGLPHDTVTEIWIDGVLDETLTLDDIFEL